MDTFDPIGFQEQADSVDVPITELIGARLPRRLRRVLEPEKYKLLRQCKPFGDRPARVVAAEAGMRLEQLYRWMHRARIESEFYVVELYPFRAHFLIEHGRELRESGGKLEHAEDYLKRLRALLPKLPLPDVWRDWLLATTNLELGHVYRDRGDETRRLHAIDAYRQSRDMFLKLQQRATRPWSIPDFSCGWIVAEQNALQMNRIFAEYDRQATGRLCAAAIRGFERVADALRDAPRSVYRYQERRAETIRLMGQCVLLAGGAQAGWRYLTEACRYAEGQTGDHVSRRIHHAEAWLALGKFDEALGDLQTASELTARLQIEKGIHAVRLGKQYCKLYQRLGDTAALHAKGDRILRSCKRLGLMDQYAKVEKLLQNS